MADLMPDQPTGDPPSAIDANAEALLYAYRDAVEGGDAERAEESAVHFMALASEHAHEQPSPDLLLKREAHRREEAGEWGEAEAAYRQCLELAVAEGSEMAEYKAHADLSALYRFLGRTQRALEEAEAATDAARRADLVTLLTMALESQARGLLHGDPTRAFALVEEMLRVVSSGKMGDTQRARGLVLRARCRVERGEFASAQADLDVAHSLFSPLSGVTMFAGVQSGLAGLWEATARLRAARGEDAGAADAWRECLVFVRTVADLPQLTGPYKFASLARALREYGSSLLAVEEVDAANDAFQESRAIRQAIRQPEVEG